MNDANNIYVILEAFLQGKFTTADYALTFIAIYLTTGITLTMYVRTVKFDLLHYRMSENEALDLLGFKKAEDMQYQPRKELCACGSGKKYKYCCGTATAKQNLLAELTKDDYSIFLRYVKKINLPLYYFYYPIFWIENRGSTPEPLSGCRR